MAFLSEPEPARGVALPVLPGIRRIVAPNPSVMTYHGTNTYLIDDDEGGISVLDPGPPIEAHIAAILAAGEGRIARIVVSHTHADHYGAANALKAATGAPLCGWRTSNKPDFVADHKLGEGDSVAGLTALHTPGHYPDHICLAARDGVLFTADHVMGWASSIVSPPEGEMLAYFTSLERLLSRQDRIYLCGHGPVVTDPRRQVKALLRHRVAREHAIAAAVKRKPCDTWTLMDRLYSKVDPKLRLAAERNVLAHLLKLEAEGKVEPRGDLWHWVEAAM